MSNTTKDEERLHQQLLGKEGREATIQAIKYDKLLNNEQNKLNNDIIKYNKKILEVKKPQRYKLIPEEEAILNEAFDYDRALLREDRYASLARDEYLKKVIQPSMYPLVLQNQELKNDILQNYKLFKINLEQIMSEPRNIEFISNALNINDIQQINSHFDKIKNTYITTYGFNNQGLTNNDIIEFLTLESKKYKKAFINLNQPSVSDKIPQVFKLMNELKEIKEKIIIIKRIVENNEIKTGEIYKQEFISFNDYNKLDEKNDEILQLIKQLESLIDETSGDLNVISPDDISGLNQKQELIIGLKNEVDKINESVKIDKILESMMNKNKDSRSNSSINFDIGPGNRLVESKDLSDFESVESRPMSPQNKFKLPFEMEPIEDRQFRLDFNPRMNKTKSKLPFEMEPIEDRQFRLDFNPRMDKTKSLKDSMRSSTDTYLANKSGLVNYENIKFDWIKEEDKHVEEIINNKEPPINELDKDIKDNLIERVKEPPKDEDEIHNNKLKNDLYYLRVFESKKDKIALLKEMIAYIEANNNVNNNNLRNKWIESLKKLAENNNINFNEEITNELSNRNINSQKKIFNNSFTKSKTHRNKLLSPSKFNEYENVSLISSSTKDKINKLEVLIGKQFYANRDTLRAFLINNENKSIKELADIWLNNKVNRIRTRLTFINDNIKERRGYLGNNDLTRQEYNDIKSILDNDENRYSNDEIIDTIMKKRLDINAMKLSKNILESASNILSSENEKYSLLVDSVKAQYEEYLNDLNNGGKKLGKNIESNLLIYIDILESLEEKYLVKTNISIEKLRDYIGDRKTFIINKIVEILIKKEQDLESKTIANLGIRKSRIGKGLNKKKDECLKLGDIMIYRNKLYNDNILSIMDNNHQKIAYLKNVKISDDLLSLFDKMLNDVKVNSTDIKILDDNEKIIFDTVLKLSKNHKKHSNNIDHSIKKLKDRYIAIIGEMTAGNDNDLLITELKDVLAKLVSLKVIPYHQMIKQLKQCT